MKGSRVYRQSVSAELVWFLGGEAEGDMGLRSCFPAMVARLMAFRSGGRPSLDLDDRSVAAAMRARGIARRRESLSERHRMVLLAAYGHRTDPPAEVEPVIGVALYSELAASAHAISGSDRPLHVWLWRLRERVRRGAASASERSRLAEILRDSERALAVAEAAYAGG